MTMMHQFQPVAALGHLKMWPRASRLLANRNTFVDRAVHRDAARARTRARAGTALRARAEQQNRGSGGKKKFHNSVFRQRQSSILAWRVKATPKRHRHTETQKQRLIEARISRPFPPDFRSHCIRRFTLS